MLLLLIVVKSKELTIVMMIMAMTICGRDDHTDRDGSPIIHFRLARAHRHPLPGRRPPCLGTVTIPCLTQH
jgi:hypothetical protein